MPPINKASLLIAVFIGAGIAFILISLFVFGVETNSAWPSYWRIRPLIIVPLAGATGGAVFYYLNFKLPQTGLKKVLLILLCVLIYMIGLWMGFVLGLDGTLWD